MPQLVRWNLSLGELALRLFLLHLLWLLGVLAGGVVLGLLPATSALCSTLREDQMERAMEERGEFRAVRPRLWIEFWAGWREEFWRAQRLGALLGSAWLLLLLDRTVLTGVQLGALAPLVSGLLVVLTVVLALLSAVALPLFVHFSEPVGRVLRMALVLLVRRPTITIAVAMILVASGWLTQTAPGVVPVFGMSLTAWAITALLWRSGVMPLSPRASEALPE